MAAHHNYQKLLSQHLADIPTMPAPIIAMFKQGAFVVSVSGRPWHSVAVDESHEMLINKDCKSSIVKPLPEYINRIARYMPYRSKSVKNLQDQLFPLKKTNSNSITTALSFKPNDAKSEHNIHLMMSLIERNNMLSISETNRGLINTFSKK